MQIIVDAIVNINLSKEEQALALQQAILHPLVRSIAKSAGLADNNNFMIKNCIMKNVKTSVKLALKTNSTKGRANNDLRSLAQSVVLASMKSTQELVEDKENGVFVPSSQQIADTIGIPKTTFQRIRNKNQERRDLLKLQAEGNNSIIPSGTVFSQVVKSKGYNKVDQDLIDKVYSFIENHPNVIQSPIMNDYVRVKDKTDPSVIHKVPKMLLQISIRELHNDVLEQLPEASKDGIPLVSDTKLREMIPPQVKKMTDRYKKCVDAQIVLAWGIVIGTIIYTHQLI